jgi:glycosyltransferase involved in cell wall biosynthesis
MHIAQIAPLRCYDGSERVIHWLADELVALGHEVTLCAGWGLATPTTLGTVSPRVAPIDGRTKDTGALHVAVLEQVRRHSNRYDFLHFHSTNYPFCLFSSQGVPFATTLHGRLDLPQHPLAFDALCRPPAVSISDSQRRPVPQANWVRTIYHGLPQRLLTPVPAEPRYFAFLGRIAPETGVDRAISIAHKCGVPIRIAARIDKENCEYFAEKIRPLLDDSSAEYIGEVKATEKSEFLSAAVALLDPADSPEPFGLAMIEAIACGTPVIAFNRGSAPEIVDDGWTGFIVEDEEGAVEVFDQLEDLSREEIRSRFEQRFTARYMALEYLDVYRSVMDYDHRLKFVADRPGARLGQAGPGSEHVHRSKRRCPRHGAHAHPLRRVSGI